MAYEFLFHMKVNEPQSVLEQEFRERNSWYFKNFISFKFIQLSVVQTSIIKEKIDLDNPD